MPPQPWQVEAPAGSLLAAAGAAIAPTTTSSADAQPPLLALRRRPGLAENFGPATTGDVARDGRSMVIVWGG